MFSKNLICWSAIELASVRLLFIHRVGWSGADLWIEEGG
jgi:hypothetical protein